MNLKKYTFIFALLLIVNNIYSQVGIGTLNPSSAAMLEVSSQSNGIGEYKGFMPPRVPNIAARNAINPGASDYGLLVFVMNNDSGFSCLQMWVGDSWVDVTCYLMNSAPIASDVDFTGSLVFGETLTARFNYIDADSDPAGLHTYNWYVATDEFGTGQTLFQSGTNDTYESVAEDIGRFIAVEVTPVATSGESPGAPQISDFRGPILASAVNWPAVQNFETTPAAFPLPLFSATGGYYTTGNNTGGSPSTALYASGLRGYGVSNGTSTVILGPIDVSNSSNATFKLRLAGFSKGNTTNGIDIGDDFTISISTDDGITYLKQLLVKGNNSNQRWGFDAVREASTSYRSTDIATQFASGSGTNATSGGISFIEITGIPNSANLKIKIEMINNTTNELWVIDDAEVWGN